MNTKIINLMNKVKEYFFFNTNKRLLKHIKKDLNKIFKQLNINQSFDINNILSLKDILESDLEAVYLGDPAYKSKREVILCYPGFNVILYYRFAHLLIEKNIPLLPRLISETAHSITGIDINPYARIGKGFFIDHGTGVVIGETSLIGENVRIYQGVTLGAYALDKPLDLVNKKRHPTIKDNVIIYANATILGGNTVIGNNVVIGANTLITHSINDNKVVYLNKQKYKIKDNY